MRDNDELNFRVSPRVLAPLGMEQLQDPALAVLELVKNSWDANATRVLIEISRRGVAHISVSDNGDGMGPADFRDRWLVIGASHKRGARRENASRPIIGEKGLGRLASYALGSEIQIQSASRNGSGFQTSINWDRLLQAVSIEDYKISIRAFVRDSGTTVRITRLKQEWNEESTEFLTTHAQFLTSVPGEKFRVSLKIDGHLMRLQDPLETIASIAEGEIDVQIGRKGIPQIVRCIVAGVDHTDTQFRDFRVSQLDPRLVGTRIRMKFYRRDKAARKLSGVLSSTSVSEVLERYQGVRIYRDGINVPPYGLHGDDWASLEKQRTATGGPTLVPGNSQLTGELLLPEGLSHLVITAGRSGFSDQSAVKRMASYVQWAVRELGTARRAHAMGILAGDSVPVRIGADKKADFDEPAAALEVLKEVAESRAVRENPELRGKIIDARKDVEDELRRNEETLRLYAQLASTGIAATSFAHEMRADFDVISSAIPKLAKAEGHSISRLISLLSESWKRVTGFVSLFKVVPVKVRRTRRTLSCASIMTALEAVSQLAPPDKIKVQLLPFTKRLFLVPAELDSILLNLVSNAIKAIAESPRSAKGKIRVFLGESAGDLHICVADNGCGVSKKVAGIMFEPLEGRFSEGTGMGLPIVKFIAERYGGSASIHSPPPGYSAEIRVVLKGVVK